MKELIEKILAYIPSYLLTLGKLLARPKTFLAGSQPDTEVGFQNALQFLVITVVLFVIVLSPLEPKKSDVWTRVATLSILEVLGVAVMACVLRLGWRIVGGRSTIRSFFTLYAYLSSVVLLLSYPLRRGRAEPPGRPRTAFDWVWALSPARTARRACAASLMASASASCS